MSSLLRRTSQVCGSSRSLFRAFSSSSAPPVQSSDARGEGWGPLRGIRILDLSRVLAGPYCCQILGDMGAEVVKVEQPGSGDDTRAWGPPFIQGESSYFLSVNRNKKSVAINLKSQEGINIVKKLAEDSDVVVENFLTGKADELGVGYETIRAVNPSVIYCSITGFGSTGPYAMKPGYDALVSAMYGMMHITGNEGGPAVKPGVALTDVITGLLAHGAILAALRERSISGLGQHVETSLMEAQLSSLVNIASNYLTTGEDRSKRWGTAHPSIVPYQTFQCADEKSIMVAVGNNKQFVGFCKALGAPDLCKDTKFSTNEARVQNRKELIPFIQSLIEKRPLKDWEASFEGLGFPFGAVRSIKESFDDVQAVHRGMRVTVDHPRCGPVDVVGPPVKYSRTPCEVRIAPPLLGQHTKEVLKQRLSMNDEDINKLAKSGVIECLESI